MQSTLEYFKTKYNLPDKGSPIEIPNVNRLDIVRWIKELGLTVGAEVGVDRGHFSFLMIDNNPQLKLYGVDPYEKYDEYREYKDQAHMDGVYKYAQERLAAPVADGNYTFIRKRSQDALEDFEDGFLDFVYIDANHEGEYPYQDIVGWAKKVRSGGLVMGHDYVRVKALDFTIKEALEKYTKDEKIDPWFVLGSFERKDNEVRDRVRSWMFVKP